MTDRQGQYCVPPYLLAAQGRRHMRFACATHNPRVETLSRQVFMGSTQYTAGETVQVETACPSGSSFLSTLSGFALDAPEYILGPGPPQNKARLPRQGQASELGYIVDDSAWWGLCDNTCNTYRDEGNYNFVYQDRPGNPGPIFAAQLTALNSSIASQLHGAWETYPPLPYVNYLYGYPQSSPDVRNWDESNSFALRDKYGATFSRCRTGTSPACALGREVCYLTFKPTIPGVYQVNFFLLYKQRRVDQYIQKVPLPEGSATRTIAIMPDRTAPSLSLAHGPGLNYAFATRAGKGGFFWIDSLDQFSNPRLAGGDQYVVVMVSQDARSTRLADVTNLGNGSYLVGYNITASGRYSVSIVMRYGNITYRGQGFCGNPAQVRLVDSALFDGGSLWCHVGSERTDFIKQSIGSSWCPPGNSGCVSYTASTPSGLPPIPPASPYRCVAIPYAATFASAP